MSREGDIARALVERARVRIGKAWDSLSADDRALLYRVFRRGAALQLRVLAGESIDPLEAADIEAQLASVDVGLQALLRRTVWDVLLDSFDVARGVLVKLVGGILKP